MADTVFYSTENHHNEREITIVNAALLVSKPPTKEKRIRIKVRMLLSETNMGSPAWIDHAHRYVATNHDSVQTKIEFRGYDLHFSAQNLFEADGAKAPRCQMKKFEILEVGPSESPEVAIEFTIYAPFSANLWQWLGAFGGESCWCAFTPGVVETEPDDDTEEDEGENDEEDDDDGVDRSTAASDQLEEEDEGLALVPSKSGPSDLAAYHEKQLDQEQRRPRGRPKGSTKNRVDPLTVNEATAF